jgi:hypothetical protein
MVNLTVDSSAQSYGGGWYKKYSSGSYHAVTSAKGGDTVYIRSNSAFSYGGLHAKVVYTGGISGTNTVSVYDDAAPETSGGYYYYPFEIQDLGTDASLTFDSSSSGGDN